MKKSGIGEIITLMRDFHYAKKDFYCHDLYCYPQKVNFKKPNR